MSTEKEKHDYSLLGSFMPKERPEDRPSIPVQVEFGDDKTAAEKKAPPEKKDA